MFEWLLHGYVCCKVSQNMTNNASTQPTTASEQSSGAHNYVVMHSLETLYVGKPTADRPKADAVTPMFLLKLYLQGIKR